VLQVVGGDRWLGSEPAVHILVWAGLFRAAAQMFPQVYVAVGRPGFATWDSALSLVVLTSAFWFGLTSFPELGVLSVCLAWLLMYPLLLGCHVLLSRRLIGLDAPGYLRAVAPGWGAAACLVAGLSGLRRVLPAQHLGLLSLVLFALAGVGIYLAYLRWVLKMRASELFPRRRARPVGSAE
jgi:O-antigen/teichoic acid export membrane protein